MQGFETVRYLADRYDRDTRVSAARLSQLIAAWVYISLVLVATPLMADAAGTSATTARSTWSSGRCQRWRCRWCSAPS